MRRRGAEAGDDADDWGKYDRNKNDAERNEINSDNKYSW